MYNWKENFYKNDSHLSREMLDMDYNFGTHPLSNDIRKKKDIESIKQSVRTLVLLNHYEKPFHPDIGCDIYKSLFELMSNTVNEHVIRSSIKNVIESYEPRASIVDIDIDIQHDNNAINIEIIFIPEGYTEKENINIFLQILR